MSARRRPAIQGLFRHLLRGVALLAAMVTTGARAEPELITIDTGSKSGVYYFAGGSICSLVNARRWETGIRCVARETDGSIENLLALRRGAADFAIVQSDWQFHAMRGSDQFEARGPDWGLRSVIALYPEALTILARGGSGIRHISDLAGKRVNIGPIGSGGRATMEAVMESMGWASADFGHLGDLVAPDLPEALCSGDLDAAVLVIAHPNLAVEDILSACDVALIPTGEDVIDSLVAEHPYFFRNTIPSGTYPGQSASMDVVALSATLVTSTRGSRSVVRTVASALVEGIDGFRQRYPAFGDFDLRQRLTDGLTAPLHPGALLYYRENRLLPDPAGN